MTTAPDQRPPQRGAAAAAAAGGTEAGDSTDEMTERFAGVSIEDARKSSPLKIPDVPGVGSLPEQAISISTSSGVPSGSSADSTDSMQASSSSPRTTATIKTDDDHGDNDERGLIPADLDTHSPSLEPPFPSPSSTFRPQPDFDVSATLDERIAAIKDRNAAKKGSRSSTAGEEDRARATDRVSAVPADRFKSASRSRDRSSRRTSSHPASRTASVRSVQRDDPYRLIVRDYAFPRDDPRFQGLPHPDDLSRSAAAGGAEEGYHEASPLGNETFASSGSSNYSWGFVTSHGEDFAASSDSSQPYSEEGVYDHQQFDDEYGDFVPGIYKALYDFEPELESEMSLAVDELVIVSMRQCAGWVQASRIVDGETTGEIGLVPENYLHLIARDDSLATEFVHPESEHAPFDNEQWTVKEGNAGTTTDAHDADAGEQEDPSTPKGAKGSLSTDTTSTSTTEAREAEEEDDTHSTPSRKGRGAVEIDVPAEMPPMGGSSRS